MSSTSSTATVTPNNRSLGRSHTFPLVETSSASPPTSANAHTSSYPHLQSQAQHSLNQYRIRTSSSPERNEWNERERSEWVERNDRTDRGDWNNRGKGLSSNPLPAPPKPSTYPTSAGIPSSFVTASASAFAAAAARAAKHAQGHSGQQQPVVHSGHSVQPQAMTHQASYGQHGMQGSAGFVQQPHASHTHTHAASTSRPLHSSSSASAILGSQQQQQQQQQLKPLGSSTSATFRDSHSHSQVQHSQSQGQHPHSQGSIRRSGTSSTPTRPSNHSSNNTGNPNGHIPSSSPSSRRVRGGFWNRRGDTLILFPPSATSVSPTTQYFIVYAPRDKANPPELADYPLPLEGFRDHNGEFIKYDPNVREFGESLPLHGEPPKRPYESVGGFFVFIFLY